MSIFILLISSSSFSSFSFSSSPASCRLCFFLRLAGDSVKAS